MKYMAKVGLHRLSHWMANTSAIEHFIKYVVAGGIATLCDLAVFGACVHGLGINYLLATAIAVVIATGVKFLLCLKFVFNLRGHSTQRAWWYQLTASLLALALNLLCMYMLVDMLGIDRLHFIFPGLLWARIVTAGSVFMFNFLIAKYIVFRDF